MGKVLMSGIVEAINDIDFTVSRVLNDNSWSKISEHSEDGANYWEIGDCKEIYIKGTVGTKKIDGSYWVYIIGFDHNGAKGIDFGTFKTKQFNGVDICLVDDYYDVMNYGDHDNNANTSKTWADKNALWFNINHGRQGNKGGWKGCDLRYDILGSTNKAPNGYLKDGLSYSRQGNDPDDYDIVNNPMPNTLLAAFPSDLRAVMKLMTVWTDNYGGPISFNENTFLTRPISNITESKDYLPLPACTEIDFDINDNVSNEVRSGKVKRYEYYSNGNKKIKYKDNATSEAAIWLTRTPYFDTEYRFEAINGWGYRTNAQVYHAFGISPIFRV